MSGIDTTHECPAPGCTTRVAFERLACKTHWFRVHPTNRGRLLRQWRDHPGEDSYFQVRAACLRDLGVPEAEITGLNGGTS